MSFTDWHVGSSAAHAPQEFSFVMATTVDDLSYTPSAEEKSRDAEQFVATGRKSWKTLKGKGEAVWPPLLEAALLEALERYSPDTGNTKPDKTMGRFPMRNRFISDYIFETTGKRRTPKQVGSRLQQLRETCKKEQIRQLISHRLTPDHSSANSETDSSYAASPSPRPESRSQASAGLGEPASFIHVKIALQSELWPAPIPSIHLISNESVRPQIIQLSPESHRPSGMSYHNKPMSPNILSCLNNSVEFKSQYALDQNSTVLVYVNGQSAPIHVENVQVTCISSPAQQSGWLYRSELVSAFWETLCSSQDLSQFAIVQNIKRANPGLVSSANNADRSTTPKQGISVVYKFDSRVNALRRSSLANALTYHSAAPNVQVQPALSDIPQSGLGVVGPSTTWQIPDADDNLHNDCLQSLTGRSRQVDPSVQHLGSPDTSMTTYHGQYQRACVIPDPSVKESNWNRNAVHAPVPLQYQHQPGFYFS
ncbi:hypothetical protein HYPSUDRAFT_49086 [Hypholoma sublateritium FD-334 SS-4]|uniref:TEA domain-containing protein n=1 Tax=Hypholoma sublateritium (strain FD-334 SS-4) TaxID=945553 RepID=A0A0D2N5R8_HYPSF|nr:hypothetical protein HYPSUDRAFT_49086 [Hypholoma sublateritium FD-334 SS-4]